LNTEKSVSYALTLGFQERKEVFSGSFPVNPRQIAVKVVAAIFNRLVE
jgi:hypothetical protein